MKSSRGPETRGALAILAAFGLAALLAPGTPAAAASRIRSTSVRRHAMPPKAVAARPASPARRLVELRVEPERLRLDGADARVQILVTGRFSDGAVEDLTRAVAYRPDPRLLTVSSDGLAAPRGDGAGFLRVVAGNRSVRVPVSVSGSRTRPPVGFVTDVVPVLTKNGCNMGACHGAAAGQGGFRLSLRGFDPDLDYAQIAREKDGARIDRQNPEASLLLRKATAAVPHGGGLRFKPDSEEYALLARWIREGAPGPEKSPRIVEIVVQPEERALPRPGLEQQIRVAAIHSDDSVRDVTRRARYASNDEAVAAVDDATGRVRVRQGGAGAVMVSYGGFVKVVRILAPLLPRPPVDYARLPRANPIDDLLLRRLAQLHIEPSPLCTDEEFLRRVYLDVLGTLPTPEEVEQFLAECAREKAAAARPGATAASGGRPAALPEARETRRRWIDRLLERPEFADYRALRLADLLRVNSQYLSQEGADAYFRWIRRRVRENAPYDALVRELLTAKGSNFHVGPANYFRIADDPEKLAEATAQTFLGVRLNCAKCHNHPFEKWTQADYYGFAAFFARVGRKGGPEFGESQIYVRSEGEVKHPKTGEPLPPRFLGGEVAAIPPGRDRREVLAEWLTSPQNLQFARVAVNRLWGELFGRGLVDPVDDFRVSNPPSHEELLDYLARRFIELRYDVRELLRLILESRAYQLSSEPRPGNERDTRHFARAYPRRLPAEVLADALDVATGKPSRYGLLPPGTRAIQIPDSRIGSYLLEVFGRPKREIVCACERDPQPNLAQMLHLTNGSDLNARIAAPDGRIARAIRAGLTDEQIVRQLYLVALSRHPRPEELRLALERIRAAGDRKTGLEDVLWAILNSQEFLFNH